MRWIAIIQAVYFAVTGVWPIVHIKSFIAVTGPKTDIWLVRTVGLLITVVGVVIGVAGWRGEINLPIVLLATGSAAALAGVDAFYVGTRVIPKIYLLDAVAEAVIIVAWGWALMR